MEPGEAVLSIERLRLVGERPIVFQQSYLPSWIADRLEGVDLAAVSLYDYIQSELQVELSRAQEKIHAIGLAAPEARLLDERSARRRCSASA